MREKGRTVGYYRSVSASVGYQAGAQAFGYLLFFMDYDSLRYLDKSDGWELGSGPTMVVLDEGFGKSLSTTTIQKGVYGYRFNQGGLMGEWAYRGRKEPKFHRKINRGSDIFVKILKPQRVIDPSAAALQLMDL